MRRFGLVPVIALMAGLVIIVGCAGEKVVETVVVEKAVPGEKVVETVVVEKVVPGEKVVETVVVEKAVPGEKVVETVVVERTVEKTVVVVQTATPVPATPVPGPAEQTLVVAIGDIAFPAFVPSKAPYPNTALWQAWGIQESAVEIEASGDFTPLLAERWEISSDFSETVWHIKPGVQFHKGWGEVTADDFVYSHEDAQFTEGTIHTGGGDARLTNQHMTKVDKYTAKLAADSPMPLTLLTWAYPNGREIYSKAAYDQLGWEGALLEAVGTGPYEVQEYIPGERIVMTAVPNHHKRPATYGTLIVRQIAEPTTRIAALAAGEVDVTDVPPTLVSDVRSLGFDVRPINGATAGFSLYPIGQFCWTVYEGEPVPPRAGYNPDLPWVGDCDDPDSMERARKVRWAMAMAIDRDALVDTIGSGLAFAQYLQGQGAAQRQQWLTEIEEKWTIPYDVEKAKQFLAEGGYPDGFTADFVIATGQHPLEVEVGEAVAGMLQAVGIDTNMETLTYQAHRVGLVARERQNIWLWGREHSIDGTQIFRRHPGGAFNPGFEIEELFNMAEAVRVATMPETIRAAQEAVWDYTMFNMISIETMGVPRVVATNPEKILEWEMGLSSQAYARNFERIVAP